ncbi:hypothetical protein ES708_23365 [subsurface metagenome]
MVVLGSEQLSIITRMKCYISYEISEEIRDNNLPKISHLIIPKIH